MIISYNYFGEIDIGYIPDFRVWGDGYIVWVEKDDFSRNVYEGYLSQTALLSLLKKFEDAEFFKDCQKYHNYALGYITISLLEKNCSILIDSSGTLNNDYYKISNLVTSLMEGAGVEKKEFVPTIGYAYVIPIEKTAYHNNDIVPKYSWEQDKFGFGLENIYEFTSDGKITGDALNFIWQVVNHLPFIESEGKVYWIGLGIPKITD